MEGQVARVEYQGGREMMCNGVVSSRRRKITRQRSPFHFPQDWTHDWDLSQDILLEQRNVRKVERDTEAECDSPNGKSWSETVKHSVCVKRSRPRVKVNQCRQAEWT